MKGFVLHMGSNIIKVKFIRHMKNASLLFLLLTTNLLCAQQNERLEDSIHIYWQPKLKLKYDDFKYDGKKENNAELYCEKIKLCACASTNINLIIDIPKQKESKNQIEKIYIVAVFDKERSYKFNDDTIGIIRQKLSFDIEELETRYIRKELEKITNQFDKKNGSIITWYKLILNEAEAKKNKLFKQYTLDAYIEPKINADEDWRNKIDMLLEELKEFATKPEECLRFISKKPIVEDYEQFVILDDNHD